jgi:adenylosuccinate lyase
MLHRFAGLVDGLRVYPERMLENLALTKGLVFSQPVLLRLIESGLERQAAYVVVQRNAMRVWDEGKEFKDLLARDPDVQARVPAEKLAAAFDLQHELRHVDAIFARTLGA